MAFSLSDLPPHMQEQAVKKWQAQQAARANSGSPKTKPNLPQQQSSSPQTPKYHNVPTVRDGIKFDSKKEAQRYEELMLMLKAGQIFDLRLQANFTLQEGYKTSEGVRIKPIVYKADFYYRCGGNTTTNSKPVVEDVKSVATKTKTYQIKKKMLREKFGIDITEI